MITVKLNNKILVTVPKTPKEFGMFEVDQIMQFEEKYYYIESTSINKDLTEGVAYVREITQCYSLDYWRKKS